MMQVVQYPDKKDWQQLLQRPSQDFTSVKKIVEDILNDVKQNGDEAIKKFTKQFDKIELNDFTVSEEEWQTAETINENLKDAINVAIKNVHTFHEAQGQPVEKIETMPGVVCWRKSM